MIQNPILQGFCPDPSIVRAGKDYYIATSTFEWWPGVKLFHSRDLKHWEQIPSPLRRESQLNMIGDPTSGGVWAPCLTYDGKYFYLVYTDVKTKKGRYYNTHNYVIYTDDPYGEWSEPVYLNSIGFDPSLFHDTDGKKYLINMVNGFKGVLVQEIEMKETNPDYFDGTSEVKPGSFRRPTVKFVGEQKKVYPGSGIGCTEGPHMYHIGEWYYLIVAEGGTGYDHCVTMARSKSVWGPFETAPENPVLTSDKDDLTALQKSGHADIVDTPDGEWYMVHLCSRPLTGTKWCTLGRETAIQKMRWNKDGWLEKENGNRFADMQVPEPKEFQGKNCEDMPGVLAGFPQNGISLDFEKNTLPPYVTSPRVSYEDFMNVTERPGYLRIYGQESMNSLHHVSLLAVRQTSVSMEAETKMEFTPGYSEQVAGLSYMYDAMNFYIFGKTATEEGENILTLIKSDIGIITDEIDPIPVPKDVAVEFKAVTGEDGTGVKFFYRFSEKEEWIQAGGEFTTEIVTDEHCRGFTGAHFGMYVHDMTGRRLHADFDRFVLR